MQRYLAVIGALAALGFAAGSAEGAIPPEGPSASLSTEGPAAPGGVLGAEGASVRRTDAPAGRSLERCGVAPARVAPEGLTEGEEEALRKLAAENPELAEQSGGYLTDRDLLTVVLVVLIILIIL